MTKVLALIPALLALVNSNNIFSDFASSICQQRYQLNGDVVCQPNGEFAARQCSATTDICYCATETGELIDGTNFSRDKNYECRNIQYDVEYKHPHRNAGFDVDDILSAENQLTKKLTAADRRNAMWEMRGVVITRHKTEKEFSVLESVLVGYNTRLELDDVIRKARNVLGVGENAAGRLSVRQIYSSVHEGECPAERARCNEDARECYSDSECEDSELCCTTECGDRCVSTDSDPTVSSATMSSPSQTPEESSPLPVSSESPEESSTDSSATEEWYKTTDDSGQTEPLNTESSSMTSQDWSRTDGEEDPTQEFTTQPATTEPLRMTTSSPEEEMTEELNKQSSSSQTEEMKFPSSEANTGSTEEFRFPSTEPGTGTTEESKTTKTPSYTEKTVDTTEPLDFEATSEGTTEGADPTTSQAFGPTEGSDPTTSQEYGPTEGSNPTTSQEFGPSESDPTTEEFGPTSNTPAEGSTELQTTFVNSLGSEETSPINEVTSTAEPDGVSTSEEGLVEFSSSSEAAQEESSTESSAEVTSSMETEEEGSSSTESVMEGSSSTESSEQEVTSTESAVEESSSSESSDGDFSSTESAEDVSSTESSDEASSAEYFEDFSSTESSGDVSSTESLQEASSSEETKYTTEVTGFPDSSSTEQAVTSTEQAVTDPLSFVSDNTEEMSSESSSTVDLSLSDVTSDVTGTPGTTQALVTSSGRMMSLCEQEAAEAIGKGREGPLCLDSGSYNPQQCDSDRDICWCVDETGLELQGSRRYGSANCDSFLVTTPPMTTTAPMGDCWKAYQKAVQEQAYNRRVRLPTCQSNGLYAKSQCHGTFCWCVDEMNGEMIEGTRKPGPIDCELYIDGVCPEFARDHDNVCVNKCDSDEVCYGTTKCCQTNCGRDCVYPQLPDQIKGGQCPAPQSMNSIFEKCTVECSNDRDCKGKSKCCFNGCGYACSSPVNDPNIYCKKVDSIYKGTIEDPRDQYTKGDVLKVSCDYGYELQGKKKIKCLASGEWESELPVCKRISCGVPGSGQFMVVRGSDYFVGGVVTYHCYSGYELRGADQATCLVSGRWDAEPPSCHRVQCPEMNELQYGRVYGRMMTYGNRIGFRCDYGYTLVGSEQRLCLSDGTWSGTDPSCVRGYFSRSRRHKFTQNDDMVGNGSCQYGVVDTIDYNGDCVENILTINCQCGEPDSVEQKVKVLCQRGESEFIERTVKIGKDCSCCN